MESLSFCFLMTSLRVPVFLAALAAVEAGPKVMSEAAAACMNTMRFLWSHSLAHKRTFHHFPHDHHR